MREVVWMGDSKKRLKEFPSETQRAMGGALMLAQLGGLADHAKPFHGVGSGVFEIAERQDKNAYRLVYAVQLGASCMCCTLFRKNPKRASARRNRTWI